MTLFHEAHNVAIVEPSPDYLPWGQLKEMISTPELPEEICVEWQLDHARSNDGARP
jgi:hypothetical protein